MESFVQISKVLFLYGGAAGGWLFLLALAVAVGLAMTHGVEDKKRRGRDG